MGYFCVILKFVWNIIVWQIGRGQIFFPSTVNILWICLTIPSKLLTFSFSSQPFGSLHYQKVPSGHFPLSSRCFLCMSCSHFAMFVHGNTHTWTQIRMDLLEEAKWRVVKGEGKWRETRGETLKEGGDDRTWFVGVRPCVVRQRRLMQK